MKPSSAFTVRININILGIYILKKNEHVEEITYEIEFADNGMIVRSFDSITVTEGNERRMSEEVGKLVYAELAQLMDETSNIKLTIKVEKG